MALRQQMSILLPMLLCSSALGQSALSVNKCPDPTFDGDNAAPTAVRIRVLQGYDAYRHHEYSKCLQIFRAVEPFFPKSAALENLMGNCAEELKDYPVAIAAFTKGYRIGGADFCSVGSLASVFSLAGMSLEKDARINELRQLKAEDSIPLDFHFWSDRFEVAGLEVKTLTFSPDLETSNGSRYWFRLYNKDHEIQFKLALESSSVNQPGRIHGNERTFFLISYAGDSWAIVRSYKAEPAYEAVRKDVVDYLADKLPSLTKVVTNK